MKAKTVAAGILVIAIFLAFLGIFNLIGATYLFLAGQEFDLANPYLGFTTISLLIIGLTLFVAEISFLPDPEFSLREAKRKKLDFVFKKLSLTTTYFFCLILPIMANGLNHVSAQKIAIIEFGDVIQFSGIIFGIALISKIFTKGDKAFK